MAVATPWLCATAVWGLRSMTLTAPPPSPPSGRREGGELRRVEMRWIPCEEGSGSMPVAAAPLWLPGVRRPVAPLYDSDRPPGR